MQIFTDLISLFTYLFNISLSFDFLIYILFGTVVIAFVFYIFHKLRS